MYVYGVVPPVGVEVKLIVPPVHAGELLPALTLNPGFTVSVDVDAVALQPKLSVTVTL